jgi:hypothetical protein
MVEPAPLPFGLALFRFLPQALRRLNVEQLQEGIKALANLVVNAGGVAGVAFLGLQLAKVCASSIQAARERWHIRSTSDAFARATFEELPINGTSAASDPATAARPQVKQTRREKKRVTVDELHAEQEEMWRVIHNIYKGQSEKIESLESATADFKAQFETTVKETETSLSLALSKLAMRLDSLESTHAGDAKGTVDAAEVAALRAEMRREAEKQTSAISALRQDVIPSLLQQHDQAIISKLKSFGDEVKSLILHKSTREPKAKPKAKPKPKG